MDQALQILRLTHDGDDLAPRDLALLEHVVNHGAATLSESGAKYWEGMYTRVVAGTYAAPWLHGIPELTRDHDGSVRWRGRSVEHFSFRDPVAEKAAAEKTAAGCMRLERDGLRVTSGALLDLWSRMRFAGELGASLVRKAVSFNRGLEALRLDVHTLSGSTDAEMAQELAAIGTKLNQTKEGSQGYFSVMPLITRQDYDAAVEGIERSVSWSRNMVWRSGSLTPDHLLYDEPYESLSQLARLVDRESLVDQSVVEEKYLGVACSDTSKSTSIQREVCR